MELRIRFININPGYNEEMVEKSPTLYQYVKFVDIVRKYQQEMPFPEAVEKAIDECIKKGILAEFLRKNRAEVLRVSIFEYDEEEHMRQEREESRQEGIEQVNDLYDKLHDLNREEDIWKAIKDVEYRKKLLEEFHLDCTGDRCQQRGTCDGRRIDAAVLAAVGNDIYRNELQG